MAWCHGGPLALGGVWESDLAAEDLAVERGEAAGRLWVEETEELQLVHVQVADGLHHGHLGHHLWRGGKREKRQRQRFPTSESGHLLSNYDMIQCPPKVLEQ